MTRKLVAATLAGLIAAALAGCASAPPPVHYALVPTKSNGQDLPGLDGRTTLESRQPGGIVSVRASPDFADFGAGFIIAVQNKSGGPLDFGPGNIQATVGGKQLPVLAAEELDARVKSKLAGYIRATNRSGTTDIDKATNEANRQYRYETFGGNPAGQGGMASCAVAEGADQCRGYRVDRDNREADAKTLAETAAALKQNEMMLKKALRPTTVGPERLAGGVVVVEPPREGGPVDITVTFNGQKHRFTFDAKPTA